MKSHRRMLRPLISLCSRVAQQCQLAWAQDAEAPVPPALAFCESATLISTCLLSHANMCMAMAAAQQHEAAAFLRKDGVSEDTSQNPADLSKISGQNYKNTDSSSRHAWPLLAASSASKAQPDLLEHSVAFDLLAADRPQLAKSRWLPLFWLAYDH